MRYFTLDKIKATDNLAVLFNAYMKALMMLDGSVTPRETMQEYRALRQEYSTQFTASEPTRLLFESRLPTFFHLQVLSNALNDLHRNVHRARKALSKFFTRYDGDLTRYAADNRLRCINEYGSDEDSDWEEDGTDENGVLQWKPRYRDDAEALAPYTLASNLEQYFVGADSSGEKIGTSHALDFATFTAAVQRQADFCPIKMLEQFSGKELPVYHPDPTGEMVAESTGERIERELNEAIRAGGLVAWFELALAQAANIAAHFHRAKAAPTAAAFQALLTHLDKLQALDFPSPPPHAPVL